MEDLSHWDFAHHIHGPYAAALILGIDPGNVSCDQKHKIQPVEHAIRASYAGALCHPDSAREALAREDFGQWIFSVQLKHVLAIDKTNKAYKNFKELGKLKFEEQAFEREELTRWLEAHGRQSIYPFSQGQSGAVIGVDALVVNDEKAIEATEKPLGSRERETLLKLVIGMAIKGFNYKPTAPKSTTPKEIADDLAELDISIDTDTVRKYLKEAASTVLPAKPHQS